MRTPVKLVTLMSGATDPQDTGLTLTCTTTGAQTLTIQGMTVATSKEVVVNWGDGNSNTYTAGAGTRTHNYAGAGTWTVTMTPRGNITLLDLRDTKLSGAITTTNPLPSGLTSLTLYNLTGLTYNANTNPLPAGLTYLYLSSLAGLTWDINAGQPWPTGATTASVVTCPSVTVSAWTDNAIRTMQFENAYSQANVDALIAAIYANRASFTYATPTLDIAGGSNAAPSGVYADEDPPTTGKGMIYELVNDPETEGFNKWAITYTA